MHQHNQASTPGVVFIMGPTAAGKTAVAISLAQQLNAEIVSVDSAMVYRGLDIGSAKPSVQELALAPHRLIDICDPSQRYSAADFCVDAKREISEIHSRGKLALLVGGTSMYFDRLEHGISPLPQANQALRTRLDQQAKARGWPYLHQRLAEIDPISAQKIHANDSQRIQRALEIYQLTGTTRTELFQKHRQQQAPWPLLKLAIAPQDRALLHERIAMRFDMMMAQGFLAEVEKLYARPDLNSRLPAIRAVGYRQLWQVLAGELNLEQGVQRAIIASRQLAKRQLTWLRRDPQVHWFDSLLPELDQAVMRCILDWQDNH